MLKLHFYNKPKKETKKYQEKINKAIYNTHNSNRENVMGWVKLFDANKNFIKDIKQTSKNIIENYDNFIVLGIGGSAMGAKTLIEAFKLSKKRKSINCLVCDNIDPDTFLHTLNQLNLRKTMFNVITKSGTTSETIAQLSIVIDRLQQKKLELNNHIIITTETDNFLYEFAKNNNIKTFEVPKDVGGRFSIFTAVGLLPACVYGLNINNLLKGAKLTYEQSLQPEIEKNHCASFALYNYQNYLKDRKEFIFMPYSDRLNLIPDYFSQLWAESLSKEINNNNKKVNTGPTPVKAIGATDQHSQLQLYTEGPDNKVFMFLRLNNSTLDTQIKTKPLKHFDYLHSVTLKQLLNTQLKATACSLIKLKKPVIILEIDDINETSIGALLYFFQMSTAYAGDLFNINAYNQPGVEQGKIYTKALLDYDKYAEHKAEIENILNNSN